LHPQLAQSALELRARWRRWRLRPGESLFHALSLLALFGLSAALLHALIPRLQALLEFWRGQPLVATLALLLFAIWRLHLFVRRFEIASQAYGWLSTLPLGPDLQRLGLGQTLLLAVGTHLLWTAVFALAAVLSGLFSLADAGDLLLQMLSALLLAGGLVRLMRSARTSTGALRADASLLAGVSPLRSEVRGWAIAPRWLGPWPELGQLQRRGAQRAWRSGRAWVWLLPLGLLVLAGEGARVLAGMLVLVVMLPWLRTVLDASARALAEAERLLLATPRSRIEFCGSAWRYPASRALLASGVFALALVLFGASPLVIALGALGFLLICGLEIVLMLHYPRSRARQRGQLMAEIALLLVLAHEGLGPAVLLPAIGMMGWHAWRARRLP
jgi:hypothetical protein